MDEDFSPPPFFQPKIGEERGIRKKKKVKCKVSTILTEEKMSWRLAERWSLVSHHTGSGGNSIEIETAR